MPPKNVSHTQERALSLICLSKTTSTDGEGSCGRFGRRAPRYHTKGWSHYWGTSKQHMKLQQPRNHDFRVSQFNLPRPQSGNDREMTTSPPGHRWEANGHLREAKTALTTTAKLRQLRANSREMTTSAESCNDREMQRPWNDKSETQQLPLELHEILRRFMAVVVSSAFRKSLNYWGRKRS